MKTKMMGLITLMSFLGFADAGSAETVTIELPEFVGELQTYPNGPTADFELGVSFLQIDVVRIQMSGIFTPAVGLNVVTGQTREILPEIELYTDPGVGSCFTFLYPVESPFDVEGTLRLKYGATWDFLLDGKGRVSAYLGWGIGGPDNIIVTPGSVEVSQAYLTIEGTIPEPTTLCLLSVGVVVVRFKYFRLLRSFEAYHNTRRK